MMLDKKRALGRGLSELGLSELLGVTKLTTNNANAEELQYLPIQAVQPGKAQPRKDLDSESLQTLADSIRAQGIIQPIVVREVSSNIYEIIAGERRWRAAKLANLQQVPAIVRNVSDKNSVALALIENIQREDLGALEEAQAFQRLIEEFAMTHQQVADITGKSRPSVSNLLRLLNLDDQVKNLLESGKIEMGHARALLGLTPDQQRKIAQTIIDKSLSVRATELIIQKMENSESATNPQILPQIDPRVSAFENLLNNKLPATVSIKHAANGKGKLVINYKNINELEKIVGCFS